MKLVKCGGRAVAVVADIEAAMAVIDMVVETEGDRGHNLVTWVGDAEESDLVRSEFDQRCGECGMIWNSAILGDGLEETGCPMCGSDMVDGQAQE